MDGVVAMARALGSLPHSQRRNGTLVRAAVQATDFAGVSGTVQFDRNGDRMNPLYSVLNLGPRKGCSGVACGFEWTNVGFVGPSSPSQAILQTSAICWAGRAGCGGSVPSDSYPVSPPPPPPTHTTVRALPGR